MRISCTLLALSVLGAASGGVSMQVGPPAFDLTLSLSETVIKAGSEARLRIVLRNTSPKELSITKANVEDEAETQYAIDVRDSRGRPVALTKYGRARLNRDPDNRFMISVVVCSLKPGETLTDVAVITKLYDLGRPGKYTIRVAREVPVELGKGRVTSNPITITVTR